ncbi:hemolysin family protein [Salinicoccus halodurans]|uniref:Hemolysin n=1 Tax=Salinicoccus halodurans TaxID=407035 RepID=A0A0F7HIM5_9STAP|nr:hemolysin family protein [Salinicoccus halodurans]AKG73116.1 hemolysins-related protein containing CBS domains [Salinicoccus halodurans]SFK85283.1 putative hemolysin [Salinicoccus halodurans]
MIIALITLIILILINAFFAASEIALIGLNDNKVKKQANDGNKKAILLNNLISEPSRFLSTIQVGITLAGFLASAFAADFFAGPLAALLTDLGVPFSASVLETVALVAITLILSYFTLVFGELVPKQLALQKAESISNVVAGPLTILFKITLPVVKLLTFSTNSVVRLFGIDPNARNDEASEEDIRMLVELGGEKGNIQQAESMMIKNIFELDDTRVTSISTHRTDIAAIPLDAGLDEVISIVNQEKYTRFPVYDGDIDNITGILRSKDLLELMEGSGQKEFDLSKLCHEPFFTSESRSIDLLLRDMQKNNAHIAIILDEYGGTEGLVTIEDIIEEVVGEILSEHNNTDKEERIQKISSGEYRIKGTIHLLDVEDFFEKELPVEEYETLNGFMIDQLGYFPETGEQPELTYNNLHFKVEHSGDRPIETVLVSVVDGEK